MAHETALKNHAQTIAVLGCGIDAPCYPPENQELLDELKKDHLVLSEYPFDEEPDPANQKYYNRNEKRNKVFVIMTIPFSGN